MRALEFVVRVVVPDDATKKSVKAYIKEAVDAYGGCYHPSDPMFAHKKTSVKYYDGGAKEIEFAKLRGEIASLRFELASLVEDQGARKSNDR